MLGVPGRTGEEEGGRSYARRLAAGGCNGELDSSAPRFIRLVVVDESGCAVVWLLSRNRVVDRSQISRGFFFT